MDGHCARSTVYVILNIREKNTRGILNCPKIASSSNERFVLQLVFITEHMTSGSLLHFLLKAKRPAAGKTSLSDKVCCDVIFELLWYTFHVYTVLLNSCVVFLLSCKSDEVVVYTAVQIMYLHV